MKPFYFHHRYWHDMIVLCTDFVHQEQEEKKKQQEEEEKAKAMELEAAAEQEVVGTKREIQEVKERLDKLEETVREVAKGKSSTTPHGKDGAAIGKESRESPERGASHKGLEPGVSAERSHVTEQGKNSLEQVPASSQKDR